MLDQVQLSIQLDAVIHPDGAEYVAFCPALDVATQAEDSDGALSALREAVEAWFESCLDRKVLHQALIERGFERSGKLPSRLIASTKAVPIPTGATRHTIACSVPAYVLADFDEVHAPG